MKKTVLAAEALTKKYQKPFRAAVEVVKSVSFKIKEGEIVGLLGRNGAGKTTILQMLLGILTPTSGSVFVFDKPLTSHRSQILEDVNFSSTYTNLPWHMTVTEALQYFSYLYAIPNRSQRVQAVIQQFSFEKLEKRLVKYLSSGQLTRLNLAKAFLNQPKLIVLDEPTASLDPETARYVRRLLLQTNKKHKTTMIMASHNMSEVADLCDQIILLDKGEVVAHGNPGELLAAVHHDSIKLRFTSTNAVEVPPLVSDIVEVKVRKNKIEACFSESKIPLFFKRLSDHSIEISQLSMQKPTLEDYFLAETTK